MSPRRVSPSQAANFRFPRLLGSAEDGLRKDDQNLPIEPPPPTVESAQEGPESPSRDLNEIERDAFAQGFEAGERAGLELAEKKVQSILERYSASLGDLATLRDSLLARHEKDLVALSLEIARKLVHREVQIDPEIILALVRVAVNQLNRRSPVTIYLSREDYSVVSERTGELLTSDDEREIVLKERDDLDRGDCMVESDHGTVDARLSEQFREIEGGLLGEFRK